MAPYGQLSPKFGSFVSPVGFAVDASDPSTTDHNAIYVLDRTSREAASVSYRLEKLDSAGNVLGTATFTESFTDTRYYSDAHPVIGLAVDSALHRVYTIVQDLPEDTAEFDVPVAATLLAWSTEPSDGALVKAPGFATEDPVTGAAVVAGPAVLDASDAGGAAVNSDLYAPAGLAVDPANHDVVIAAQLGPNNQHGGLTGGPTILQRVHTEAPEEVGKLGASWQADATISPNEEEVDGIFNTEDGFGVDLQAPTASSSDDALARVVQVGPDFSAPAPEVIVPFTGESSVDLDEAPGLDLRDATAGQGVHEAGSLSPFGAGSPVTQLSDGTYASVFAHNASGDSQGGTTAFWSAGAQNLGIRLFAADGTLLGMLGGAAAGQLCSLDGSQLALAAGSNGTLFALVGESVVELGPGGSGCPDVSGTFAVNGKPVGESLPVEVGAPVSFDASTIQRAGESPFEVDWDFTGATSGGSAGGGFDLGSKIEAAHGFAWPTLTKSTTFASPGVHPVKVRLTGDYGTYVAEGDVTVTAPRAEQASFTATTATATTGQSVTFVGTGSPGPGASSIKEYRWSFGDGSSPDELQESNEDTHVFNAVGTYEVTLTVVDDLGHEATSEPGAITVTAPVAACVAGCPATACGSTCPASPPSSIVTPPPGQPKPVVVKPLTKAQKLAAALRACKKESKKKRKGCEKQAKKKYAPKPKKVKKKAKK